MCVIFIQFQRIHLIHIRCLHLSTLPNLHNSRHWASHTLPSLHSKLNFPGSSLNLRKIEQILWNPTEIWWKLTSNSVVAFIKFGAIKLVRQVLNSFCVWNCAIFIETLRICTQNERTKQQNLNHFTSCRKLKGIDSLSFCLWALITRKINNLLRIVEVDKINSCDEGYYRFWRGLESFLKKKIEKTSIIENCNIWKAKWIFFWKKEWIRMNFFENYHFRGFSLVFQGVIW